MASQAETCERELFAICKQCIKRKEDSMEKEREKLATRMKQTIAINKQ
jgi:hypothetical protein